MSAEVVHYECFATWWPEYVRGCAPLALDAEHRAAAWSAWRAGIKAEAPILAEALIAGWTLAPAEPTTAMVEAGKDERMKCLNNAELSVGEALSRIYRAMCAATPRLALDGLTDPSEDSIERATAEPLRLLAPQPAPPRNVVPGKVHCALCGFSLRRINLYMLSGTTGAGGEETEPCPNDGTPLLPVTWEQEAREAWKMAEQQFDRAHALEAAAAELLACKDLKDEESRLRQRRDVAISRDREATARVDAMREDYNRRKPLAWGALRDLLPKNGGTR